MKISRLALALMSSIALPLAALAAGKDYHSGSDSRGAQGPQAGSSQQQYGTQSGTQSGTGQSDMGTGMGRSGAGQATTDQMQSDTGRARSGAEGSAGLPMFDTIDRNSDGHISKSEARKSTMANRNFRGLDTDRDGKLSREEWEAGSSQPTR